MTLAELDFAYWAAVKRANESAAWAWHQCVLRDGSLVPALVAASDMSRSIGEWYASEYAKIARDQHVTPPTSTPPRCAPWRQATSYFHNTIT